MGRKVMSLVVFISLVFLSGCWDVEEINRRAKMDALFIDLGENPGELRIGGSFPMPGSLLPPITGTEQQFAKRHYVLGVSGRGMVDAWAKLQANVARNVFYGQLRTLILTERLARRNINDLLDFIGRIPSVPPDITVLMTKSDPEALLDMKNRANFSPGDYIELFYQSVYKHTQNLPLTLWQVNARLDNRTSDPHLPIITPSQGMYQIAGTTLFSGNRMAGELDMHETQTLALLTGSSSGYLAVPRGKDGVVGLGEVGAKTTIRPVKDRAGKITFFVTTRITGVVWETIPRKMELRPPDRRRIEALVEEFTKRRIIKLLAKLRQLNSDPVGFGEKFRIKYPAIWEQNQWYDIFPTVDFKVRTQFTIHRTGIFR